MGHLSTYIGTPLRPKYQCYLYSLVGSWASKYLHRSPFKASVSTIRVHGAFGLVQGDQRPGRLHPGATAEAAARLGPLGFRV